MFSTIFAATPRIGSDPSGSGLSPLVDGLGLPAGGVGVAVVAGCDGAGGVESTVGDSIALAPGTEPGAGVAAVPGRYPTKKSCQLSDTLPGLARYSRYISSTIHAFAPKSAGFTAVTPLRLGARTGLGAAIP